MDAKIVSIAPNGDTEKLYLIGTTIMQLHDAIIDVFNCTSELSTHVIHVGEGDTIWKVIITEGGYSLFDCSAKRVIVHKPIGRDYQMFDVCLLDALHKAQDQRHILDIPWSY